MPAGMFTDLENVCCVFYNKTEKRSEKRMKFLLRFTHILKAEHRCNIQNELTHYQIHWAFTMEKQR